MQHHACLGARANGRINKGPRSYFYSLLFGNSKRSVYINENVRLVIKRICFLNREKNKHRRRINAFVKNNNAFISVRLYVYAKYVNRQRRPLLKTLLYTTKYKIIIIYDMSRY